MFLFLLVKNIALGKTSSLSSTLVDYFPTYANDGNRNGSGNGSYMACAISHNSSSPWWQVDLGDVAIIERIAVKTLSTPSYILINPFDIRVGNDNRNGGIDNPFCAASLTLPPKDMKTFTCPTRMMGRYVSINLNRKEFLIVCEVEVYGWYE